MNRVPMREQLAALDIRPKKAWGQNFLVDQNAQDRIVAAAALGPRDAVVEIGAGLGALTGKLADAAGSVIAIERDPRLASVLTESIAQRPNVSIVNGDALEFDFQAATRQAGHALVVVGNLPYQITSPLLFMLIEAAHHGTVIQRAVVMVQREFAERASAEPGGRDYGRLSVMLRQYVDIEKLFSLGAGAFYPQPAVASTVLRLVPRPKLLANVRDEKHFAAVVRAAFGMRRKMLRGALGAVFGSQAARDALDVCGIDETRRAETLPVADFARLSDALPAKDAIEEDRVPVGIEPQVG
jgi:16S rRNA (adenine1518-N6/adenine1519-N6)-dimethyltransferase